jgi:hypothetical protein
MYSLDRSLLAMGQFMVSAYRTLACGWHHPFSMEPTRGGSGWHRVIVVAAVYLLSALPTQAKDPDHRPLTLTLVDRRVTQDQGTWVIDYRLRAKGTTGVVILPEDIVVKLEGWVSNSRIASHAVPRWSSLAAPHGQLAVTSEVIAAADESHRCRERLIVSVWAEDQNVSPRLNLLHSPPGSVRISGAVHATPPLPFEQTVLSPLSVAPDSIVRVRLRLEHQHILYGDYDPLLSTRAVELTLGSTTSRDLVPLDREQYLALPRFSWPEPPEERRDTRHAISGPDSLHIEAHVPGHQYYRYPERPVRYSTKMRLQFWYLIAAGTEGECRVAIAQYKDTPTSWRKLNAGSVEQALKTVGRWTKIERVIQTEAEATTLTLEFKIIGETEIGEMWIDDVSLEPIGCSVPGGP